VWYVSFKPINDDDDDDVVDDDDNALRLCAQVLYTNAPLVVSAPTGSGKTVIFELAIIRLLIQASMQQLSAFKVVYSRPIVSLITFCVSRRRCKMYCGHARLCVCVCVCVSVCLSAAVRPHYCTDPDVTWRRGTGCPLVVHYWADLQSVHRLRCYGNITRTLVTSLRPSRDMTT